MSRLWKNRNILLYSGVAVISELTLISTPSSNYYPTSSMPYFDSVYRYFFNRAYTAIKFRYRFITHSRSTMAYFCLKLIVLNIPLACFQLLLLHNIFLLLINLQNYSISINHSHNLTKVDFLNIEICYYVNWIYFPCSFKM